MTKETVYKGQDRLIRTLKLKDYFNDSATLDNTHFRPKKQFREPSKWIPSVEQVLPSTLVTIRHITDYTEHLLSNSHQDEDEHFITHHARNLNKRELQALRNLSRNNQIIIKPSDKAGSIVVLDREHYINECMRQLSDSKFYHEIPDPIFKNNIEPIYTLCLKLRSGGFITEPQFDFLSPKQDCKQRQFYILPKVHKNKNTWPLPNIPPGRPIVSDVRSECYNICKYIDSFLLPLSIKHASYIKNTPHFLSTIRQLHLPANSILVTGDVSSLYTNMNINRTLAVVRQAFNRYPVQGRPDNILLELLTLTLKNNDFNFNGKTFLQVCGLPMGRVFSPSLANLYLMHLDDVAMMGIGDDKPLAYLRFLDDIFSIWTGSADPLRQLEQNMNSAIPGIKITFHHSESQIDFLDTTVFKFNSGRYTKLHSKVFFKDTATHNLIHTDSFHPPHTHIGVLKSQLVRFRLISDNYVDYINTCSRVFQALQNRGYNKRLLRAHRTMVWNVYGKKPIERIKNKNVGLIPIVLPFNSLSSQLINNWKKIVLHDPLYKEYAVRAAYCNNKNLKRHLVTSKLKST